jgi:hypothetical protein
MTLCCRCCFSLLSVAIALSAYRTYLYISKENKNLVGTKLGHLVLLFSVIEHTHSNFATRREPSCHLQAKGPIHHLGIVPVVD